MLSSRLLHVSSSLALALLLTACHGPAGSIPDSATHPKAPRLEGTYGIERGAVLEPILKVDETKTGYQFEERTTGEWRVDPQTPHVLSEAEAKRILGRENLSFPVFGLATDSVLIAEVPESWQSMPDVQIPPGAYVQVLGKPAFVLMTNGHRDPARKVELGSR